MNLRRLANFEVLVQLESSAFISRLGDWNEGTNKVLKTIENKIKKVYGVTQGVFEVNSSVFPGCLTSKKRDLLELDITVSWDDKQNTAWLWKAIGDDNDLYQVLAIKDRQLIYVE